MRVLYIYVYYYENDKETIDHKDCIRTSFLNAFKDIPDFSIKAMHLGDGPNDIKSGKELNEILQREDFDIALVGEEKDWVVTQETIKKLGKKLFLFHFDGWLNVSSDLNTNFRITYKKPRVWSALNQPLSIQQLAEHCNILVTDYGYGELYPNVYGIMPPQDTEYLKVDESVERNVDVSHIGMMYTQERIKYAQIFNHAKLNILYTGGVNRRIFPAKNLSKNEFARAFQSSKITLSLNGSVFSNSIFPNYAQRKGKIVQAGHCKTFCLSTYPEVFKHKNGNWFVEGVHYDSINENNCVDKIRYYLQNPHKAEEMANNLYDEVIKNHSAKRFWEKIFEYSKA
jgi:hypothetical protein